MKYHGNLKDETGNRYGRLQVLTHIKADKGAMWLCACDCGEFATVKGSSLRDGKTKSCGCLFSETVSARNRTHGLSHVAEYKIWEQMKARCLNPNNDQYEDYGGRGISVSPEYMSFAKFYEDVGPRPSAAHTLERVDNDKGYSPGNCTWVSRSANNSNKRKRGEGVKARRKFFASAGL